MIPTLAKPEYPTGTRLRITQHVRVGHRRWLSKVEGVVVGEYYRPVGGIEMGTKAAYCHQKTLRLQKDHGEITEVALDEATEIEKLERPGDDH
jgi:hypothetical protein